MPEETLQLPDSSQGTQIPAAVHAKQPGILADSESRIEKKTTVSSTSDGGPSKDTPASSPPVGGTLPVWRNWKILVGILGILAFAGILFTAYKLGQKKLLPERSQTQPLPTSPLTPTLTPSSTSDWETYTNIKWKYQISYPSFWRLNAEPDIDQVSLGSQEKRADGSAKFLMSLTVWGRTSGVSNLREEARFKGEEFGNCPSDSSPFMGICAPSQPKQIVEKSTDYLPFLYYVVKTSGKRIVVIPLPGDETRFITVDSILWPKENSWELFDQILSTFRFLDSKDTSQDSAEGKFCGGIFANLPENQCPSGYRCQLEGDYPDAGGRCVRE